MKKYFIRILLVTLLLTLVGTLGASAQSSTFQDSAVYESVCQIVDSAFEDFEYQIQYDESNDILTISIVASEGWAEMVAEKNPLLNESWDTVTQSFLDMSSAAYKAFEDEGYSVACAIMLMNDSNEELALYACLNGIEVYNATKEGASL